MWQSSNQEEVRGLAVYKCPCCGEMIDIAVYAGVACVTEFEGHSGEAKREGQSKEHPADWGKPVQFGESVSSAQWNARERTDQND